MDDEAHLLDKYKQALRGISVSHAWRGHGSAIFLEFGKLTPKLREDGTTGNPDGELSLMIEWSWRLEEADYIACGSGSEDKVWRPWLAKLIGKVVLDVTLFGRLPELMLALTDDLYLSSFMTAEGHPEWALIDHRNGGLPALVSMHGRIGSEDELSP